MADTDEKREEKREESAEEKREESAEEKREESTEEKREESAEEKREDKIKELEDGLAMCMASLADHIESVNNTIEDFDTRILALSAQDKPESVEVAEATEIPTTKPEPQKPEPEKPRRRFSRIF